MLACTVLLLPLPYTLRRWLLSQITSGRVAAQLQYTLRVLFLLVAVLLLDALHRAGVVASVRSASAVDSTGAGMLHSHNHADMLMRRFYAQRNVYLCGFTLFLAFVLNRLVVVVAELVGLEGRLRDASASASPILGASTSVPATDEKQDTSTASNADMDMVEVMFMYTCMVL